MICQSPSIHDLLLSIIISHYYQHSLWLYVAMVHCQIADQQSSTIIYPTWWLYKKYTCRIFYDNTYQWFLLRNNIMSMIFSFSGGPLNGNSITKQDWPKHFFAHKRLGLSLERLDSNILVSEVEVLWLQCKNFRDTAAQAVCQSHSYKKPCWPNIQHMFSPFVPCRTG